LSPDIYAHPACQPELGRQQSLESKGVQADSLTIWSI
jgi:hypothetical protein